MKEEKFWGLLSQLNWDETGDDEAVVEPVVRSLSKEDVEAIFEFEDMLSQKLYKLDTKAHAKRVKTSLFSSHISADYFLYWRCAVVANGKDVYESTLKKPRSFPKGIDFEPLLYIASSAYELKTNKEWGYSSEVSYETYSNQEGWK